MSVRLLCNDIRLNFEKITWSGSHNQSSRKLTFTLPSNPYDKTFENVQIKLGDIVYFYYEKTRVFTGVITSRERTAEIGTVEYTAKDFMHYLLRSSGTYKFKNKTAEYIAQTICKKYGITVGKVEKTKINIPKVFFENQCEYDIVVKCYRMAYAKTRIKYMLLMDGAKFCVIKKGTSSGVTLDQNKDITSATYSDTTDNMVNIVKIYNDSMNLVGTVKNQNNVNKYGHYESVLKKEKGTNSKKEAQAMLVGVTKEASVEAIGNIKAISGYSIKISDAAVGLTGKFFIASDTHIFENGIHTMSLELAWNIEAEEGAEVVSVEKNVKKKLSNASKAYYLDTGSVFHSISTCSALSGKTPKRSTVEKILKIKISKGTNKGKSKYKACDKCWRKK